MGTLIQDVKYGVRMLAKNTAFTLIVVLTLSLGIGANTAIFSMVNAFLLRPLPVRAPEQIVVLAIQQKGAPVGSSGFSYPEFNDFRTQERPFSNLFSIVLGTVQLAAGDNSETCFVNFVSRDFFSTLGVRPATGRLFLANEGETSGEPLLVVLGHRYWQRRFYGDPGVVGRQIRVDGQSATVIGVVPREFQGMYSIFETDVYLPLSAMALQEPASLFWNSRDQRRILAFARLKPGVSLRQEQSSLDVISRRLARQYPATDQWFGVRAEPEKSSRPIPYANNSFVMISGLFLVLAGFVLLLACMNIENMLLARGSIRQREMAIRTALGAGRTRLVRQMLTETILLGIIGGATGMFLGAWANQLTRAIHLESIPLHIDATFDWRVFTFVSVLAILTGTVVGLLPALRASTSEVNSVLHEGEQRNLFGVPHLGIRNFLIVAQVAGALMLLVAAGLFVRSLGKVQTLDLGFDPNRVLNVIIDTKDAGYDKTRATQFYREIESRVRSLPGVQSASLASYLPMGGFPTKASVSVGSQPVHPGQPPPSILFSCVDAPYFETLRISLLRGRVFTESDGEGAPLVAIVNQAMANRFWPGENPVGKRFSMEGAAGPPMEIVGVVANGKYQTIGEDTQSFFYVPLAQNFASKRALQIRSLVPPESLIAPVKEEIDRIDPEMPVMTIETMKQSLEGAFGFFVFRLAAKLAACLGFIGLILGVIGVYGVVSFTASQRTREIGIRVAMGAKSSDILKLVWKQGVRLVIAGVILGMIAAWALARTMTHVLVGVSTSDPETYIIVAVSMLTVGLAACWIPARRAMRVDPMVALRYE